MFVTRLAVVLFLLSFVLFTVVLPTLRHRRATGRTGYVAGRTASPVHSVAVEGLRTVVFGLLAWTVLVVTRPPEALGIWRLPSLFWPGLVCMAAGQLVVAAGQRAMGTSWRVGIDTGERTALVTGGPFRWVRNPIFSGMLLAALGLVALTPSPWTLCGWLFLLFVLALQVRLEEQHLLVHHGEAYARYAAEVGRFLPRVGRLTATAGTGMPG